MLKRKALRRIYLTTLVLFIMLITLTINSLEKKKEYNLFEVEYVSNLDTIHVYLLNEDSYLVKVDFLMTKNNLKDQILEILNELSINNKKYNNLKGLIPSNTKVNDIYIDNDIVTIDFSNDLLKVNENIEEKVVESIVYSLLELNSIKNVIIKIDGKSLTLLPKSNKNLPILLNESIGINKDYEITSIKDTKKVVIYYVFKDNKNDYYVPVTKYVNSHDDKVKIIIDSLKGNYFSNTNLSSYLNGKTDIDFNLDNDILTLTFKSLNENNLESVTYSLASSIFSSMDVKKVIFEVNEKIIDIKTKN